MWLRAGDLKGSEILGFHEVKGWSMPQGDSLKPPAQMS